MRPQERREELPWLGSLQSMGVRLGKQAKVYRMGYAPPPSWKKVSMRAAEERLLGGLPRRAPRGPIKVSRKPQPNHRQGTEMGWVSLKAISKFKPQLPGADKLAQMGGGSRTYTPE